MHAVHECSPNFQSASITRYMHSWKHEPILLWHSQIKLRAKNDDSDWMRNTLHRPEEAAFIGKACNFKQHGTVSYSILSLTACDWTREEWLRLTNIVHEPRKETFFITVRKATTSSTRKGTQTYFETTVVYTMQSRSFRGRHKSKTILQTASLLEWNWQHDCGMKPQPPSSLPYCRRGVILERVSNDWVFKTPTLFNLIEEKQSFRVKRTSHVGSLLTSLYWARPCVHPEIYHTFRPIRACVTSWLCYKTFLTSLPAVDSSMHYHRVQSRICLFVFFFTTNYPLGWGLKLQAWI